MKNRLLAAIFVCFSLAGCAFGSQVVQSERDEPTVSDEGLICAEARSWLASTTRDLNQSVLDKKFITGVDDCTFVQSVGLGYATYFIDGFERDSGIYLGRMVRVLLFEKSGARWNVVGDGNVIFMPTKEQRGGAHREEPARPIEL